MRSKEANRVYMAEYYAQNKERLAVKQTEYVARNQTRVAAYKAEYYAKNRDKLIARQSEYRARNADEIAIRNSEYVARNRAEVAATRAKWRANNGDKMAAGAARRRATERLAMPSWLSPWQHLEMNHTFTKAREMRERTGILHHVDHIVPLKGVDDKGNHVVCGFHVPWNLQIIEDTVNMGKGGKWAGL